MSEFDNDLPQFAIAGLTDVVRTTNTKGETRTEFEVSVKGNSAEAVEHLVSHLRKGAEALGAEFESVDGDDRSRSRNSSFHVSNWGSGSAWKHASEN